MGRPCIIQGASSLCVDGSKFRGELVSPLLKYICVGGWGDAGQFKSIFSEVNAPMTEAAQQTKGGEFTLSSNIDVMHGGLSMQFLLGPEAFVTTVM